jgi:hypothetical protein
VALSPSRLSAEQRRALKLLAGSPDGCTTSIMLAHLGRAQPAQTVAIGDTTYKTRCGTYGDVGGHQMLSILGEFLICRILAPI